MECTKIIAPILINVFAKLQIVSTIKRDALSSTIHLQGMGFHLYTLLVTTHCLIMIQFYNTDTDLRRLLQTPL